MTFFKAYDEISEMRQAFHNICLDKMLNDGYIDMSAYIFGRFKKDAIYSKLLLANSKYACLYKDSYPKKDSLIQVWFEKIKNADDYELTQEESKAIVNWFYRSMKNAKEREDFTIKIFHNEKELYEIKNNIKHNKGVFYNAKRVQIEIFTSINKVSAFLSTLREKNKIMFYRGHADANYRLKPSILRTHTLAKNENVLYQKLIIECPEEFERCRTHFEKLVKMQHYGLPTRLLDITRNPLVALYFACESCFESYGELILFSCSYDEIKYPLSDTVSILLLRLSQPDLIVI